MNIRWTPRASSDLQKILDYLNKEWGERVRLSFIERLNFILQILVKYPRLYPETTSRPGVRRCVVTKHSSLYFRITNETIELLSILDNRSKPS